MAVLICIVHVINENSSITGNEDTLLEKRERERRREREICKDSGKEKTVIHF